MSDPGTTYRTSKEIQRMRSTQDPIAGPKQKVLDWEVTTEVIAMFMGCRLVMRAWLRLRSIVGWGVIRRTESVCIIIIDEAIFFTKS